MTLHLSKFKALIDLAFSENRLTPWFIGLWLTFRSNSLHIREFINKSNINELSFMVTQTSEDLHAIEQIWLKIIDWKVCVQTTVYT